MARESDLVRETLDGYVSSVILGHIHICIHFIYIYLGNPLPAILWVGKKTYLFLKKPI